MLDEMDRDDERRDVSRVHEQIDENGEDEDDNDKNSLDKVPG